MPLPPTPYPRAWIEFDGQPVPNDAVRSLSLETNVTFQADSLELLLDNGPRYSDFIAKERAVNCWLGYVAHPVSWHKDELVHVFSGGVDGVLPTWGADMTLTVRCRDHTRRLIDSQGDPAWAWTAMTDAEVVAKLAARAGLQADIAPATGHLSESEWTSLTGLDAYGLPPVAPSGWDIVQQLAIRNGYVAVVTVDGRLYFGPRGGVGTVPILGSAVGAAIATAILGTWTYFAAPFDLLAVSFDDSALVVNKVTVARWLGEDAGGYAGGSAVDDARLKAARGRVIERTIVSTTAADEAGCTQEAVARLKELTRAAITATATVEGDPRLVGDVRVRLAGEHLGRFANDYYVLAARHLFGTDGYTTDLQLSSERPEASEVYRPSLSTEGALTPEQTEAGGGTCPERVAAFLAAARTMLGVPYVWGGGHGGDGRDGLDCSGFVAKALRLVGLPDWGLVAEGQAEKCAPVPAGQQRAGDLVFWGHNAATGAFHVGIVAEDPTRTINETPPHVQEQAISSVSSSTPTYGRIAELCPPAPMKAGANQAVDPTGLPSMQSTGGGNPQRMVDNLKPLAYAWEKQTGIPATIMLAINASESNWGNAHGNTLFGMGAHGAFTSETFGTVSGTHAERSGTQALATYPDANTAYADFVDVVTSGRYAPAYARLKAGGTGLQFVADLQSAGYAEDVDWAQKIAARERQVKALL